MLTMQDLSKKCWAGIAEMERDLRPFKDGEMRWGENLAANDSMVKRLEGQIDDMRTAGELVKQAAAA